MYDGELLRYGLIPTKSPLSIASRMTSAGVSQFVQYRAGKLYSFDTFAT